jgi:transglutaminase-like putative cysteine protease
MKKAGVVSNIKCNSASSTQAGVTSDDAQQDTDPSMPSRAADSGPTLQTRILAVSNRATDPTVNAKADEELKPTFETLPADESAFFLRPTENVQSGSFRIQSLSRQLTAGKTSDYQKAMAIHDWVVSHVAYDTDSYFNEYLAGKPFTRKYDALEVLENAPRTAVCQGYANLTTALLRAAQIPTRVIEGYVSYTSKPSTRSCSDPDPGHAWIEAWVNGQWLPMDTTDDAGGVAQDRRFIPAPSRQYMNRSLFNATHTKCRVSNFY